MLMTIFGQNDFWNVSIVTVLILALIKLFRVLGCQSIEGYPAESFSQVEILEKLWRFEFSKISRKVALHTSSHLTPTEA